MSSENNSLRLENHPNPDDLEREIYKSSLKQVVSFLNTTLPPVTRESEESSEKKTTKKTKIKKNEEIDLRGSYLLKSVTPTREKSDFKKKEDLEKPRKRVNSFSERKLSDLKINKKLRKSKNK